MNCEKRLCENCGIEFIPIAFNDICPECKSIFTIPSFMQNGEKIRLEVVSYYSTKVNQHVYYIITFIFGGLTYLSGITNIMDFIQKQIPNQLGASIVISTLPLVLIVLLLIYLLGRTYYWDILLGRASRLNYKLEYKKNKDHYLIAIASASSEENMFSIFQLLARIFFIESSDKKEYKRHLKWRLASFSVPGNHRLYSIILWNIFYWIGLVIGVLIDSVC